MLHTEVALLNQLTYPNVRLRPTPGLVGAGEGRLMPRFSIIRGQITLLGSKTANRQSHTILTHHHGSNSSSPDYYTGHTETDVTHHVSLIRIGNRTLRSVRLASLPISDLLIFETEVSILYDNWRAEIWGVHNHDVGVGSGETPSRWRSFLVVALLGIISFYFLLIITSLHDRASDVAFLGGLAFFAAAACAGVMWFTLSQMADWKSARDALIADAESPEAKTRRNRRHARIRSITKKTSSSPESANESPNSYADSGRPLRTSLCSCGSGKRYKHCHGRHTPASD